MSIKSKAAEIVDSFRQEERFDRMASRSRLSAEIAEIDVELENVENEIRTLKKRKHALIERKRVIERRIEERNETTTEDISHWESDSFSWSTQCYDVLRKVFRLADFRPLQRSAINSILSKEDTLIIMSTGGGKSLCYQLPAVLLSGITLVVSPLISLIEDQLLQLTKLDIEAATLNQSTSKDEAARIQKALTDPDSSFRLLYVTPEKLAKSKRIMNRLEKCAEMGRLKVVAIDEVHCCSQWGHDFRPDFKFLNVLKRQLKGVPILGLTATATADVIDDVKNILSIPAAVVFRAGFNRPNLYYEVGNKPSSSEQFLDELISLINNRFGGQSGIIYCFSRKECEDLTHALRSKKIKAAHYHAYLESDKRSRTHEMWISGEVNVIVATVAFGMGIDKADVRYVIHHSMAKSMENYYQESGRAGRDGKQATCILYYRLGDLFRQSTMVCTEKTGVSNLYSMLAYCIERNECRRSLIAEHFNEAFERSLCAQMCDICSMEGTQSTPTMDITSCWRSMLKVIDEQSNVSKNDSNGRITGLKLVELVAKKERSLCKESIEIVLAHLLLLGYLQEDFHFTPYSIISYVVSGPKSAIYKGDTTHRIQVDIPSAENDKTSRKRSRIDSGVDSYNVSDS
uniref:ATP-dependent DNA helicase n=1 Tax=Parascaris univalens TaxID=6257 RepID=A0A915AKK7_PARUN